jgi:cytochrome d ubiquinol oxidase subunit II
MLGVYVLGLGAGWAAVGFGALVALCLAASYAAMGAAWLIYKSEGELQEKAVRWLRYALVATVVGMAAVSLATPFASPRIFDKWFVLPQFLWLLPLPVVSAGLFMWLFLLTFRLPAPGDRDSLKPFLILAVIFAAGFAGLAYSFYPYVVPDRITIWEAAAAPESLGIILVGTAFVLPVIIGYSFYAYRVFGGKAGELRYD